MLVELDKKDLIRLVRGSEPSYEKMDHVLVRKCGYFAASYGTWHWNYGCFDNLLEDELWKLYLFLKI